MSLGPGVILRIAARIDTEYVSWDFTQFSITGSVGEWDKGTGFEDVQIRYSEGFLNLLNQCSNVFVAVLRAIKINVSTEEMGNRGDRSFSPSAEFS